MELSRLNHPQLSQLGHFPKSCADSGMVLYIITIKYMLSKQTLPTGAKFEPIENDVLSHLHDAMLQMFIVSLPYGIATQFISPDLASAGHLSFKSIFFTMYKT